MKRDYLWSVPVAIGFAALLILAVHACTGSPSAPAPAAPVVAPTETPVADAPAAFNPAPAPAPAPTPAATPAPTTPAPVATPAPAKTGGISWGEIIGGVISTLITAFLLPLLKRKAEAAKAEADNLQSQRVKTDIEARGALVDRLKAFLWGTASAIAEKRFPMLAQKIVDGNVKTSDDVKVELYAWGADLRTQAVDYFKNQGVDVIAAVGDVYLDKLIERAANAVSPFPGKETAVAILKSDIAPMILREGVDYVRQKMGLVCTSVAT
jgi:hypothetical protein